MGFNLGFKGLKYTVWEVEHSNMIEVRKGINSEALLGRS